MGNFYSRVAQVAAHYEMTTRALLKRCGIPYSTFRSSRFRNSDPQSKNIRKVLQTCPKVRAEWLLFGKGEMLAAEQAAEQVPESEEVARLKEQVEKLTALVLEKERRIIALETRRDG